MASDSAVSHSRALERIDSALYSRVRNVDGFRPLSIKQMFNKKEQEQKWGKVERVNIYK
jgi:hypothetical protein